MKIITKILILPLIFLFFFSFELKAQQKSDYQQLLEIMNSAIKAFWNLGGTFEHERDGQLKGWAIFKTIDSGDERWGIDDKNRPNKPVVSILEPGTPGTGMAFLRAYQITGNKLYLEYALEVGKTLLSIQKDLGKGGWASHAVVIPEGADTQGEVGRWTSASLKIPREQGELSYPPQDHPYVTFDDGISFNAGIFLVELYGTIKDLDFSDEVVDPLENINKYSFLNGAKKLFELVDSFQNYTLIRQDFEDLEITKVPSPDKTGPHPFVDYLRNLPDHPLNHNRVFKPYEKGGLPQGVRDKDFMITAGAKQYGARAAGYPMHKTLNDYEISRLFIFLMRYYEITGDIAAFDNLLLQLDWLVEVFNSTGSRAWCQQYHVLDDKPAPARPWEAPAFAMMESVKMLHALGYVEKNLEKKYKLNNPEVRRMMEDATYYIYRTIEFDDTDPVRKLFRFYAIDDYTPRTIPSADAVIRANDPLYACDFYYLENPFSATCDRVGAHYYAINEEDGEFINPENFIVSNISAGGMDIYAIKPECLEDETRSDFHGCLDLNVEKAINHDYWQSHLVYWGWGLTRDIDEYLNDHLPNEDGYWVSTKKVLGKERSVISTSDFRYNVLGLANFFEDNWQKINDTDCDGFSDEQEQAQGTDPLYPDVPQTSEEISETTKAASSGGCSLLPNNNRWRAVK